MTVRIPRTGKFTWRRWAIAWVTGGIPAAHPRGPHPLTHTSVAYRAAREEPTYQGGPLHLYNRFDYLESPPVRNLVQLAGPPAVGDLPPRWTPPRRLRRYRAGRWLTWGAGWPNLVATRSLFERFWYRPVAPPVVVDPNKVADRRAEWAHRGRRRWRWWSVRSRPRTPAQYRSRWWTAGSYAPSWDFARRRWQWYHTPGIVPTRRVGLFRSVDPLTQLYRTTRALHRRARRIRSENWETHRAALHRRYLFERIPRVRRRGRSWRRWCRHRRERLEQYQVEPTSVGGQYHRVTRGLFRRWAARPARLERLKAVRPVEGYLHAMHTWVRTSLVPRVGTPLEYNLFHSDWGFLSFRDRKGYKTRRWRLQDHPRLGAPFLEARDLRWRWFQGGGLQEKIAALSKAEKKESSIYNAEIPPLVAGPYAAVYWSLQPWGRGSRWRTRPTDRARYVWVQTVKGGYACEHDAVQWSHACTASTGVNYSQLGEVEFPRVSPPDEYILPWQPAPPRPTVPPLSRKYKVVRWLTPLWRVYWVFATVWSVILTGIITCVGWWLVWGGATPVAFMWYVLAEGWSTLMGWAARALWAAPGVQTLRWTYTAWVLAYHAEDDPIEESPAPLDEEANENYAEDENDPTGEDMIPEAAGAARLRREEPNFPWEWWWYKDLDEFYEEGLEMAMEILTEDLTHGARLVFAPWVDFWFRLPLWAFLDGVAALLVAAKIDYQRWWWRTLTRGNTTNKVVGRWWKIPLVVVVNLIHAAAAAALGILTASVLDPSTLKVWVVYTCGLPWHDEYYWGWLVGWLTVGIRLVGPRGWQVYLAGLGWSNLLYLLVGGSSLVYPEDYYPHRSATVIRSGMNNRTLGIYSKVAWLPDEADRLSAGVLSYAQVDPARVIPAALVGYNEMPWELDVDDGGYQFQAIPHMTDRSEEWVPEYPRFIGGRWAQDMAQRHPRRKRNNFYDVDFVTDLNTPGYTWPSYYKNARNRHTRHDANADEISSNYQ